LILRAQGEYAAARRLYERAVGVHKEVLGERHAFYAATLANLAALQWAQRDYAGAARRLQQALAITQRNLDLVAAAQSECQQLVLASRLRVTLDAYLSLAPFARLSAEEVYRHVLAFKGVVLERQRRLRARRRELQKDPRSPATRRLAEYE